MSDVAVKKVIGKLISNQQFGKEFFLNPAKTIENAGYSVTSNELEALAKIKPEDLKVLIKRDRLGNIASFGVETFSSVKTV